MPRQTRTTLGARKTSTTILIHKKGDESLPSNWRPISLQPTIYKVYAAILARRLASWALQNKKISSSQKGFLPFEGCAEHSFLLRSALEDSKRRNKTLRVVWLDLKNAFGSVPHNNMWEMMNRLDVPQHFITICREIYEGSSQAIRSAAGFTDPLPVNRGIKQGCPLSPLLFNLVLEGVLPQLERTDDGYRFRGGATVSSLAYADDLCLIGTTKDGINHMLGTTANFLKWAGLQLNLSKCASLSMINDRKRKYVEPFQPDIGEGRTIPALKWEDRYKYLGVSLGRERKGNLDALAKQMSDMAGKITSSGLTDWQKIDAMNTFLITKASYHFDTAIIDQTWATKVNAQLRKMVKKALHLPNRTTTPFFYTAKSSGGLGLTSLEDTLHTTRVSHLLSCLSSTDKRLNDITWSQLTSVVKRRRRLDDVTTADIADFLNHPPFPQEKTRDVRSLWNTARKSLKHLSCSAMLDGAEVSLSHDDSTTSARQKKPVRKLLKEARDKRHLASLLEAQDQGRTFSPRQQESLQQPLDNCRHLHILLRLQLRHPSPPQLAPNKDRGQENWPPRDRHHLPEVPPGT